MSSTHQQFTPATRTASGLPHLDHWWQRRDWYRYLRDLLLFRSRRRYNLSISADNPLGATDPHRHEVLINPTAVAYPGLPTDRARIRGCPVGGDAFEQAIATALVEHEAAHVLHSGDKPALQSLAWLWNSLEDERIEALQAAGRLELAALFDFLGDAVWLGSPTASDLLVGCLLWRWEHDRAPHERKFRPSSPADRTRWERDVRPLVEAAWVADSSDRVTEIARRILAILGLHEDGPVPPQAPAPFCGCDGGEAGRGGGGSGRLGAAPPTGGAPSTDGAPLPPRDARLPGGAGAGRGHDPNGPAEADPGPLVDEVGLQAARLARMLRPPQMPRRPRPHPTRGALDIERVRAGLERPFRFKSGPTPRPDEAWFVLVDVSDSMNRADQPGTTMYGAVRTAMWLALAAERADVALGVGAFDGQPDMIPIRRLARGPDERGLRRIAGLDKGGGTRLAPAMTTAICALETAPVARRLLMVLLDGDLTASDREEVRALVALLPRRRIHLAPLYLGNSPQVAAAIRRVLGEVIACPDLVTMTERLQAWLRARRA
jgi:hypothetical protein